MLEEMNWKFAPTLSFVCRSLFLPRRGFVIMLHEYLNIWCLKAIFILLKLKIILCFWYCGFCKWPSSLHFCMLPVASLLFVKHSLAFNCCSLIEVRLIENEALALSIQLKLLPWATDIFIYFPTSHHWETHQKPIIWGLSVFPGCSFSVIVTWKHMMFIVAFRALSKMCWSLLVKRLHPKSVQLLNGEKV
jgi:hypothetical protein